MGSVPAEAGLGPEGTKRYLCEGEFVSCEEVSMALVFVMAINSKLNSFERKEMLIEKKRGTWVESGTSGGLNQLVRFARMKAEGKA